MEKPDAKGGWWSTLPGVLTAIAAVVTAVTGLIVAIGQLGIGSPPPPAGPNEAAAPASPAVPAPATAPAPLDGKTFKVDDKDRIIVRQSRIDGQAVAFALEVAPTITWWKGLKIYDENGRMISLLATQDDDKGPKSSKSFPAGQFGPQVEIVFAKAKFLGAHTDVAKVAFPIADCRGYLTTFYWESD